MRRYDIEQLTNELGRVELVDHVVEDHVTPSGVVQQFLVALTRFEPPG